VSAYALPEPQPDLTTRLRQQLEYSPTDLSNDKSRSFGSMLKPR
jgi:hypothetical protein